MPAHSSSPAEVLLKVIQQKVTERGRNMVGRQTAARNRGLAPGEGMDGAAPDPAQRSKLFRVASSESSRSSQTRLVAWIKSHPGRAAQSLLRLMAEKTGRDGEAMTRGDESTPAVAKNYFYRFFKPALAGPACETCESSSHCAQSSTI